MLSIREIFRSSSKLSAVNIFGGALAALVNLLVARRIGPEAMGIVGMVQLWLLYASFARLGALQAAYREMLHLMGQGRDQEARALENVALTAEGLFMLVPLGVMVVAGCVWQTDPRLRAGMLIGALTFLGTSLFQFIDTLQWAYQRFSLITRVSLLQKLALPVLTLGLLYTSGVYGVLAAPAIVAFLATGYYLLPTAAIDYTPSWNAPQLARLTKIGFPLIVYGFLYWGFRTSDRAMAASWLSIKDLGYFTFAMTFITQGCQLVSDFLNVLQANLFNELGRVGTVRPLAGRLERISLLILLCTGAAAGLAQAAFYPAVAMITPKFLPGVPAFEVLVLNLVCTSAPLLAYSVLLSAALNRQNACTVVQAVGLAINVALGWFFTRTGWGLPGIAWSSAISQLGVAVAAYCLLHGDLFEHAPASEYGRFYAWITGLILATFALHFIMQRGPFSFEGSLNWPLPFASRLLLLSTVWGSIAVWVFNSWWKPVALAGKESLV